MPWALTSGAVHPGAITIGDLDAYQFGVTAGDSLVAHVGDTGPSGLTPRIRVYDSAGERVAVNSGTGAAAVEHRALLSGTYTVVVSDFSPGFDATGSYDLHFVNVPGALTIDAGDDDEARSAERLPHLPAIGRGRAGLPRPGDRGGPRCRAIAALVPPALPGHVAPFSRRSA